LGFLIIKVQKRMNITIEIVWIKGKEKLMEMI
jgi:hypothetical protein